MTMIPHTHRAVAFLVAGALVFAGCGGAVDEQPLPTVDPTTQEEPAVSGACVVEEPECDDTVVVGDEPEPLPSDDEPGASDDGSIVMGGALAGDGLTVSEALATDATGILAVRGFIVDDGNRALLCELLAESLPPQCGGASVEVVGYEALDIGPLRVEQGVTWTDKPVVIFGELSENTLVADPTVAG